MLMLLWVCLVWFQWIHNLTTTDLRSVARTYCPFSDLCTLKRADDSFKPTDKETPCCSPCSCDSTCWKLGNCCPDIDEVSSAKSAAYKFDCIPTKYDYYDKPEPTLLGPETTYRIITTCPEDYEDTTTVNKCVNCTQFMPESYDDIVVVSDAYNHDIIFMNKYCAECNNVENIERWSLVTGLCGLYNLAETLLAGPDLYKYIITECDVISEPSPNIQLTSNVFCSENLISACNVTGRWDVYDAEIERACGMWYTPFFEAHKWLNKKIRAIYQNSFCYHCNSGIGLVSVDVCANDAINGVRDSLTSISYAALLDLSLTLSNLEKQKETAGICAINEIYSDIDGICRRLYCPVNENPYNGQCLDNSLDMSGLVVQVKVAVIPTELFIVDGIDAYLDEYQLQRVRNDLLRHMKLAICDLCTSSGFFTHIINGIYSDIKHIVFELRIATNKRCKMDRLATSLKVETHHKQFKLKAKQTTVQSAINILYYDVDTPNTDLDLNASITNNFDLYLNNRLCNSNFKITPVFFCPFVTFTEEEYLAFLNASQATTAGDLQSHHDTNVNNKIFRMTSFNSSIQGTYATCIENLYVNPNNKCVRCCCTFDIPFLVGVVLAVHVF